MENYINGVPVQDPTLNPRDDTPEPRQVFINDVLIRLERAFPDTNAAGMPFDPLDDVSIPEAYPVKG